jgi:RND family efflux transporter MFP subunit
MSTRQRMPAPQMVNAMIQFQINPHNISRLQQVVFAGALTFAFGTCVVGLQPANAQNYSGANSVSRSRSKSVPAGVSLDFDGFTVPRHDILVAAVEIGRLEAIEVSIGDRVKQGQIIARLENDLQWEAVQTAKFRASMHGETDAAKVEADLAKLRLEQLRKLHERQITRPDELKRAQADWEIARSRELASREQVTLRELELARAELQLERRNVRSPIEGIVAEIFRSPGEYITPADPAVIRLLADQEILAVFNIPVDELGGLSVDQTVSVYLMSLAKSVRGTVASISPAIDGESGTIEVKVSLDNQDGSLRAGDRCRMKLHSAQTASRLSPTRLPRPTMPARYRLSNLPEPGGQR